MRVKMCSITVDDPATAHTFYTEVLGFTSVVALPEQNLFIVGSPEVSDGPGILLEPLGSPEQRAYRESLVAAGIPWMVLGSTDVVADYERLSAAGVRFTVAPEGEDEAAAIFDDGCGNLLQLHQD